MLTSAGRLFSNGRHKSVVAEIKSGHCHGSQMADRIEGFRMVTVGGAQTVNLYQLADGPVRFNELLRRIEIAQGTLSKQLKYLEQEGIIRRNVQTEGALKVEYELTPIGKKFKKVLTAIEEWGEEYIAYLNGKKE